MEYMKGIVNLLHHLFIPRHSNNFKARSLHLSAITFYIAVLIFVQFLSMGVRHIDPNILGFATDINTQKILQIVNEKRVEVGLSPLTLSPELTNAANQKAHDMFAVNYWAHISPTGVTPWVFITQSGYDYLYAGENLAKDFDKSDEVVEAWMNSPTHRANILKPEYVDIGLAVVNGKLNGQETTLVVEEFGAKIAKKKETINVANIIPSIAPTVATATDLGQTAGANTLTQKASFYVSKHVTKTVSFILAEFLLVVLFVDSIYIWKYKTYRISGHTIAHLLFIATLLGAMGVTGIGVIL